MFKHKVSKYTFLFIKNIDQYHRYSSLSFLCVRLRSKTFSLLLFILHNNFFFSNDLCGYFFLLTYFSQYVLAANSSYTIMISRPRTLHAIRRCYIYFFIVCRRLHLFFFLPLVFFDMEEIEELIDTTS